jgi:hypothetical protein
MNLFDKYSQGLSYTEFLARYASEEHRQRWQQIYDLVNLARSQRDLLRSFTRKMHVLCLAGAWCGDCANQCPIFEHFASVAPVIQVRFLDRDDHADFQREVQINGGNRVPVVAFFSEDGFEVSRYGERTLSKYRQLMRDLVQGPFPPGVTFPGRPILTQVIQDWLDEFERVQWLLRLSPRLRKLHGD